MSDTKTLADLIAANPGVVKPGMSVADVKRALVAAQGQNVDGRGLSPATTLRLLGEGKRVWKGGLPGAHVPVTTVDEAHDLANAMADSGHYPAGLDACFVAGLNGDAADGCPFAGTPDCTCDTEETSQ